MSKNNNYKLSENLNSPIKFIKNSINEENRLFQVQPNNSKEEKNLNKNFITSKHGQLQLPTKINSKENTNKKLFGPLKNEKDIEKQLLYYFKDKKIYIEIYNGNINSSQIFYSLLLKYKIIQCKKLSKKIDYIVYKDGHLKTRKYALLNNIKMVDPLWIDDKINKHIFKEDKEYEIKENFGDIILKENNDENNVKDNEDILNKNFELELEAEYDTEYAKIIDKQRECNEQKIEENELTTNYLSNNDNSIDSLTKNNDENSKISTKKEK